MTSADCVVSVLAPVLLYFVYRVLQLKIEAKASNKRIRNLINEVKLLHSRLSTAKGTRIKNDKKYSKLDGRARYAYKALKDIYQ